MSLKFDTSVEKDLKLKEDFADKFLHLQKLQGEKLKGDLFANAVILNSVSKSRDK